MGAKTLIISHLLVFGAGVALGKSIDAGELATYREAHESWPAKIRRRAGVVAIGTVALGGLVVVLRLSMRASRASQV